MHLVFFFRRQSSGRLPWRNGRLARSIAADPGTTAHESLLIGGNRRVKLKQSQGFKVTMLRPSKAKEKRITIIFAQCHIIMLTDTANKSESSGRAFRSCEGWYEIPPEADGCLERGTPSCSQGWSGWEGGGQGWPRYGFTVCDCDARNEMIFYSGWKMSRRKCALPKSCGTWKLRKVTVHEFSGWVWSKHFKLQIADKARDER